MRLSKGAGQTAAAYAVILGAAYIILGLLEVIEGFGPIAGITEESILGVEWIPADLLGGVMAIIIGAVYFGATPLCKAKYESLSFLLVGALLSAVFGVLYLLVLGANGFGAYLAEELSEWEWMTDLLRPEIWLFFASTPLGIFAWRATKTK